MSSYDVALQAWGSIRLAASRGLPVSRIDRSSIKVSMDFDAGYACCNMTDPDCHCTQAIAPTANVVITGFITVDPATGSPRRMIEEKIDSEWFEFSDILREIVEAGDGVISL